MCQRRYLAATSRISEIGSVAKVYCRLPVGTANNSFVPVSSGFPAFGVRISATSIIVQTTGRREPLRNIIWNLDCATAWPRVLISTDRRSLGPKARACHPCIIDRTGHTSSARTPPRGSVPQKKSNTRYLIGFFGDILVLVQKSRYPTGCGADKPRLNAL